MDVDMVDIELLHRKLLSDVRYTIVSIIAQMKCLLTFSGWFQHKDALPKAVSVPYIL